jgi:uncharacterized protein (DUF433 family)
LGVAGRIMKPMEMEHVEEREGGYYVADTRVSLDSIVYAFHEGESPETIQQKFPSLTPEEVYGAIAFYLGRQPEIDANIRQGEEDVCRCVPPLSQRKPEAYAGSSAPANKLPIVREHTAPGGQRSHQLIVAATFRKEPTSISNLRKRLASIISTTWPCCGGRRRRPHPCHPRQRDDAPASSRVFWMKETTARGPHSGQSSKRWY